MEKIKTKHYKSIVPTSSKQVRSMFKAHHIPDPSKGGIKSMKKLGKVKVKSLKKRR